MRVADAQGPTNERFVDLLAQALQQINELAEGQRRIAADLKRITALTSG
jgi:hypothetical protein